MNKHNSFSIFSIDRIIGDSALKLTVGKGFKKDSIKIPVDDIFNNNGAIVKLLYESIPIEFSSGVKIRRTREERLCEVSIKSRSYKVNTWDVAYQIYKNRQELGSYMVHAGLLDVELFLFFEFRDWFQHPNLGVWVLTQLYPDINIYGWTDDMFQLLIRNIVNKYRDTESLLSDIFKTHMFIQYILLADDYYQTQWLINYGQAKDYSYLKEVRDSYIGKDNPPPPIILPRWWEVDYSHSKFSNMIYLEAKSDEIDYIMRNISPTRERAEAILNEAISLNIPVTQVVL